MSNMEFRYLYRDGGNYKKWGVVVFSNPEKLTSEDVSETMQQAFLPDGLFIAEQIRVPDVFLYAEGKFSQDDHCYHEFDSCRVTVESVSDLQSRSVDEFVAEVTTEAKRGWQVFDPYDSEGSFGSFLASRMP